MKDFITNASLVISALFVISQIFRRQSFIQASSIEQKIKIGVLFGMLGLVLMVFGMHITSTVIVDVRHLATVIAAFYGGMTASIISAFIIAVGRVGIFGINPASITATINIVLIGVLCGFLSSLKVVDWKRFQMLNVSSLLIVSLTLYINLAHHKLLFSIYANQWITSLTGGLLAFFVSKYIAHSNRLFQQIEGSESRYRNLAVRYSSVVNNIKEVIFQTNTYGKWIFLNPAWEEILGFTIEESIHTHFLQYVHPSDREHNNELFKSLIEGKKEYCRHEVRYLTKNGGFRWVEVFSRLTTDEQGHILGTSGTLTDITERRLYEEQLHLALKENSLLAEAVSNTKTGVMITDPQQPGNPIIFVNPAFTELTGYTVEDVIGKNPNILQSKKQNPDFYKRMWATINNTGHWDGEIWNKRKNGEVYIELISITSIKNNQDQIIHYVAVFSDITERKRMEQDLKDANERLRQISSLDGLTGIANRRYFDEYINKEWNRSVRNNMPISLIFLDIDFFKLYNDNYGHQGGDDCLKQVATAIKQTVGRSADLVARYGGEEFVIVLPETDLRGALVVAEGIRSQVGELNIPHIQSPIGNYVTVSMGVACHFPKQGELQSIHELIHIADRALYLAKQEGRNNVKSMKDIHQRTP